MERELVKKAMEIEHTLLWLEKTERLLVGALPNNAKKINNAFVSIDGIEPAHWPIDDVERGNMLKDIQSTMISRIRELHDFYTNKLAEL